MFCVYLTIYRGKALPPFYIGSSTIDKINSGYRGSVNSKSFGAIWRKELTNTQLFKTTIIKVFDTREQAYAYEDEVHRKLKVVDNPLYINMSYASNAFSSPMTPDRKSKISKSKMGKCGLKHSQETKNKMSAASKGRRKSASHILAMRLAFTGRKRSSEAVEKARVANTGKKRTEESKRAISRSLLGKQKILNEFGNFGWFEKYEKHPTAYIITNTKTGEKFITSCLQKFCESMGAYATSFLRTLAHGKPLKFGKFAGWQVNEKLILNNSKWRELIFYELSNGFGKRICDGLIDFIN